MVVQKSFNTVAKNISVLYQLGIISSAERIELVGLMKKALATNSYEGLYKKLLILKSSVIGEEQELVNNLLKIIKEEQNYG